MRDAFASSQSQSFAKELRFILVRSLTKLLAKGESNNHITTPVPRYENADHGINGLGHVILYLSEKCHSLLIFHNA